MTVKCFFDRRITPAHTGKTYLILHLCLFPDHPRSHGENFLKSGSLARMRGSPPRMRGKPDAKLSQVPDVGITPAHAGKTQGIPRVTARKLRITPARTGKTLKPVLAMGSPPHARGKQQVAPAVDEVGGITPARTGKTLYVVCTYASTKQYLVQWDKTTFNFVYL